MNFQDVDDFEWTFQKLQRSIHDNALSHGFWDGNCAIGTKLMLVCTELGEAMEAHRDNYPKDKHLPHLDNFTVELADAVIRIMDLAQKLNLDLSGAILAKHEFNKSRPHKHGKVC